MAAPNNTSSAIWLLPGVQDLKMKDVLANIIENVTYWDWILLTLGILLTVHIVGTWRYDFFRTRGLESTRPTLPFLGDNVSALLGRRSFPEVLIEQYKRSEGHGVFGMFEFTEPMLMIRDPELLKIITVKEFDKFINHRDIKVADPIFSKLLINLQDQKWRDMRATLSPAFTTSKIKRMFHMISQCGDQMDQHLQQMYGNEGTSRQPTNMKDLFSRLANDVIATVAFGVSCDSLKESENQFYRMGKFLSTFSRLRSLATLGYLLFPRVMKFFSVRVLDARATKFFDTLVHETIRERQSKNILRPDMLHLLMQARQGDLKPEDTDAAEVEEVRAEKTHLNDDDVTAQAVVFFFAGFETVSTALCFASYALSHNDEVQKKLQEEIKEKKAASSGDLTYEVVQSMKYLDAVVNEVLRMYPPAIGTDRLCREDANLPAAGKSPAFVVRKGQVITIPIIALHHDAQYWPEPDKFDPERFNDQNKPNIRPFTYMPFGLGPRICIGQRLALLEIKLALIHLLSTFDLLPSAKMKHPLQYETGLNVTAKGGFWCDLSQRSTSVS